MPKFLTSITLALCLSFIISTSFASEPQFYTFKNKLFSMQLPVTMTLRNEYCTPREVNDVHENVFVLANYGGHDKKAAVSGKLDPQVRSIITIRRGKFDPQTGAAVSIVFLVDGIRQRRGMPVSVKERLDTYHDIKTLKVDGHLFKTFTLTPQSSPVTYTFYSGVIDHRLVSMIWTAYSKHAQQLKYYSSLAHKSLQTFQLYAPTNSTSECALHV